jgi:hypothetical protein
MADLFPFQDIPGLLTPEMQSNARSMALLSAGAGLLGASGPSPYKNNWAPALGAGVQGLLSGYEGGINNALKQQLTRQAIAKNQIEMGRTIALMKYLGIDPGKVFSGDPSGITGGAVPAPGGGPVNAPAAPAPTGPEPAPSSGVPAPPGSVNLGPITGASSTPIGPDNKPIGPAQNIPIPPQAVAPPPPNFGDRFGTFIQPDRRTMALAELIKPGSSADILVKNAEAPPESKIARDPAVIPFEVRKAQALADQKAYDEEYHKTQTAAVTAEQERAQIATAQAGASKPGFYSGVGEEYVTGARKVLAGLGFSNPDAVMKQELPTKAIAGLQTNQIREAFAGQGLGQVRVAELIPLYKSIASMNNTPYAMRAILELQDRAQQDVSQIGQMARIYRQQHGGKLDAGWDDLKSDYYRGKLSPDQMKGYGLNRQGPITTAHERAHLDELGAPTVNSHDELLAYPKGTKVRAPDGHIIYAPGPAQQ